MYYKENIFTCSYHLKTITANELLTVNNFFLIVAARVILPVRRINLVSFEKGNAVYIIFFIKVKASNELSIAAHVFIFHLTGF
jgi:hypothetical protein